MSPILLITEILTQHYAKTCMSFLFFETPTLKALNSIAQGKRHRRATLGYEISNQNNPVGVAQFAIVMFHPFRVRLVGIIYPRVARLPRLPWAMELSPFRANIPLL